MDVSVPGLVAATVRGAAVAATSPGRETSMMLNFDVIEHMEDGLAVLMDLTFFDGAMPAGSRLSSDTPLTGKASTLFASTIPGYKAQYDEGGDIADFE